MYGFLKILNSMCVETCHSLLHESILQGSLIHDPKVHLLHSRVPLMKHSIFDICADRRASYFYLRSAKRGQADCMRAARSATILRASYVRCTYVPRTFVRTVHTYVHRHNYFYVLVVIYSVSLWEKRQPCQRSQPSIMHVQRDYFV